ncbi:MAG: adenylate/guanylate cyclase domain-containing protein [Balneola sp.]|nr:MAG: adenylate/guanylate cyclase domain-containing protein [Balneola sp.]
MNSKLKDRIFFILNTIAFWFLAFMFYDVFRRMGLSDQPGIELLEEPLTRLENLELNGKLGFLTGLFFSLIEFSFERPVLKRRSLGMRLLIKSGVYLLLMHMILAVGLFNLNRFLDTPLSFTYKQLLTSGAVWSITIYFFVCSVLYSFLRMVNEKFGPGVLWDMMRGKYLNPRVEKKIFMFLDLKSSTALAEKMGYLKYSTLIQQCFYDLNEVVQQFDGQIYQYVGDEAVIAWDYEKGINENKCIDCYFSFQRKLFKRKDFYQSEFGLLPEFKAGLHGGELVVTEVGVVKKEIAYHGDVINTTARIQAECNTYGEQLLISEELVSDLALTNHTPSFIGEVMLKGKELPVKLHSVKVV